MEITNAEGAPFAISAMFDRVHHPPRGRSGGGNGEVGKVYLGSGKTLRQKGQQPIPTGDRLFLEMPGGGGFGDPHKREPALVAADVRNGLVSAAIAREAYAVVLTADGEVDAERTRLARGGG